MNPPRRLVRRVLHWPALHWPVESQLGSRRNALVASTALAQLRAEREDVEDFLAHHAVRRAPRTPLAHTGTATRDVI